MQNILHVGLGTKARKQRLDISLSEQWQDGTYNFTTATITQQDPLPLIGKRVWEIGWGGNIPCTQNAGTLLIGA